MLPAVFGLIGVILGGIITAGSTYLLQIRREKREDQKEIKQQSDELRKAARVIASELQIGAISVENTIERGFYRLPHDSLDDNSWEVYRTVFASNLSPQDWADVWVGVRCVLNFRASRDQEIEAGTVDVSEELKEQLRYLVKEIETAQTVLARFA